MNYKELDELVNDVIEWGEDRGILGIDGQGTIGGQANKMMEEALETFEAAICYDLTAMDYDLNRVKDGIGDTMVTLIMLADLCELSVTDCLDMAYETISKRKGRMIDGKFVKEEESKETPPLIEELNKELQQEGDKNMGRELDKEDIYG